MSKTKEKEKDTVTMKFPEDKFVDGKIFANKGEEVEVPKDSVERWMKRGGVLVDEHIDAQGHPGTDEAGDTDLAGSHVDGAPPPGDETGDTGTELGNDEDEVEEQDETTGKKKNSRKKKSGR